MKMKQTSEDLVEEYYKLESQGWGEPGGLLSLGSHRVGHD